MMLEKRLEQHLREMTRERGGLCLKFTSPSLDGIPDRLILLPNGKVGFVEVKQKGKVPRKLQVRRMNQLKELGYKCYVLDEKEQIPHILSKIGGDAL